MNGLFPQNWRRISNLKLCATTHPSAAPRRSGTFAGRWTGLAAVAAIALTLSPTAKTQTGGGRVMNARNPGAQVIPNVVPSSGLKVLLLAADEPGLTSDVQAKLQATGRFSQVDVIDARSATPTLAQLQAYDSILVWSDYLFADRTTLGNNLADYVDGGGGVVVAVFADASVSIGGRFYSDDYYAIEPGGQNEGAELTLGTIYNPNSPLMTGVSSFDGGTSSYHSVGSVNAKAMRVADWSDGEPLVVTRIVNGVPRVDLSLWPPSSDARSDLWVDSTDGATLMANALQFVHPSCVPVPASLLGWWKGEGDATDSQNSFDGVFNGTPAFATGEVGRAFSFDGEPANFVLVPPNASLDLAQFTIDAWIYPTTSSGIRWVVDKGAHNLGENYLLALEDGNVVEVDFNNGSGGHQFVDSTIAVPVNAWSHVAGTYDGNTLTLYINGVSAGTFVSGQDPRGPNPVTQGLKIGGRNNPPDDSFPFQGLIDEVEVFDRALSQQEVQGIYDAFYAGKCPCVEAPGGMIAWWAGNDSAADIQGAHDATLNGAGFGPGEANHAFTFNGTSDDVILPASNDWNFGTGDFTVDFWEQSSDAADIMYALSFEPNNDFTGRNLDFDFNDSHGIWVFWNGGGGNNIQVGSVGAYTDGNWHHFALTRVGTTFTLYVDGTVAGTIDDPEAIDLSGGSDNYIGARSINGTINKFWNGSIDEVEVFNRGLSADEVGGIYHAGGAGKCRPYYTVAVSSGAGGMATGGATVRQGTSVEVSATADGCDTFAGWFENNQLVSSDNPYDFVVKGANRNLVATFNKIQYQISASASPSAGGSVSGAGPYDCGSQATLMATAKSGYQFVNWTESGTQVSTSATYSFTVSGSRTLVANFKQTTHLGTANGSGTIFTHNNQASFNFTISDNNKKGTPSGTLTYTDTKGGIKLTSTAITSITLNGKQATFSGKGTIPGSNPRKPTQVSFTVVATDNATPGTPKDTFSIQISSPYYASGNLTSGNIVVN